MYLRGACMANLIKSSIVAVFVGVIFNCTSASELPEGKGKEAVQAVCFGCHANRISNSLGYERDDWVALIDSMIDLSSNKTQQNLIVDYLVEHFPPNEKRAPTLITGKTTISFKEWVVPSLGQRSRDPVEAPDGSIWWVGQWGNVLGRIDAVKGTMQEYPLPKGAMPHSVTPDDAGKMWYMGNKNATVGRFDPETGKIKVYDMPDANARDPHTGEFDKNGMLWFTLQHSNRVGRLDPNSGEINLVTLPTAGSRPYGIKVAPSGEIWVACNGSNCLVKLDPVSMNIEEVKLPNSATKVRRLDIAADGTIWYVNSSRGRLGRYHPNTGEIREWPSPSGPNSHPYAIEVLNGVVWYNESAMRPDALVRFDPASMTFQSWAVPSGDFYAGIIRHMRATKNGDLLIHQSATNRIIRVEINE